MAVAKSTKKNENTMKMVTKVTKKSNGLAAPSKNKKSDTNIISSIHTSPISSVIGPVSKRATKENAEVKSPYIHFTATSRAKGSDVGSEPPKHIPTYESVMATTPGTKLSEKKTKRKEEPPFEDVSRTMTHYKTLVQWILWIVICILIVLAISFVVLTADNVVYRKSSTRTSTSVPTTTPYVTTKTSTSPQLTTSTDENSTMEITTNKNVTTIISNVTTQTMITLIQYLEEAREVPSIMKN